MEPKQYTALAKILHWTMAIVIIVAWGVGYYSSTLSVPQKIQADSIMLHKSIATLTIFLLAARIAWRLTHRPPETTKDLHNFERQAGKLGHLVLYICMLALPVAGWLWSSAAGYPIPVAHLFSLPPLMAKTPALVPIFKQIHIYLSYLLAFLVCGHALMALKHHFIDKNESLKSMVPAWLARRIGREKPASRSISI
ncbi:cytochrome B561 [Caballeronia arvi]|uniref:Cytochrome B561 n=1 Tax=Caballeronia arvi TaxID=1777135 RepID=A0A158J2H5_9BURK|nr:cytochrome b [Caballeronia arvi]SAL63084.1 cytochrome B561 [Caballeronia arvi]